MISLSTLVLSLSLSGALPSPYQVFSRWAVEVGHPPKETALELYQRARLSGLGLNGEEFISASTDGRLEKRSLLTGEALWQSSLGADIQSDWAIDTKEMKVYGGDTKGNLYYIDYNTGKVLWKTASKGVFYSKPLVGETQLWVMNSRGTLASYDKATGQWLWQQNDPDLKTTSLWSFQGPVFFNNAVVMGFPSGVLQGFEPKTGRALWNESFSLVAQGSEGFNDLKALRSTSDYLFASSFSGDLKAWVSMKGGKSLLWQKKVSLHSPMQIDGQRVYFSARDGSVQAVEIKTGYVKWTFELPEGLGSQPSIGEHYVWVGTTRGKVFVFSKEEGTLLGVTNSYQASIWNPPLLVPQDDSQALVITENGIIRRLHLAKVK